MKYKEIFKTSEKKYLWLVLILCILHALQTFIFSCLPFIFHDPILTCYKNTTNGTLESFLCDQNIACDHYQYSIDYDNSPKSITTEYELICDKRYEKPTVQTLFLVGTVLSGFSMSIIRINPYKRPYFLMICYTIAAISGIIASLLDNLIAITAFMALVYLFTSLWYANIYTYTSEIFPLALKKIVPSLLSSSYGIGTMIYALFTLGVDSWRYQTRYFYCVPILFFVLIFFIYDKKYRFEAINIVGLSTFF